MVDMETSHFFRTFLAMTRVVDFSWLFLRFHFQWTVGNMAMTCSGIVVLAAKHLLETAPNLWRLQHRGGVLTPSVAGWINGSIGFLKSRRHVFDSFSSTFLYFSCFFLGASIFNELHRGDGPQSGKHLSFHLWQVAPAYWSGSSKAVSSSNLEADQEIDGRFAG